MGSPDPGSSAEPSVVGPPDGISAFVARVLDQLTLTAWLPAAVLAAGVAVLLEFRHLRSANLLAAMTALTADPVRVLVVTIPLLVLATVVTQAFSFEAIRALEGYWPGSADPIRTLLIHRHLRRKRALESRRDKVTQTAFSMARPRMLRDGLSFPIVNAMEAQVLHAPMPALTPAEAAELAALNWRDTCDPWWLARLDWVQRELEAYPVTSRVMPTKLGNLMRTTEDDLKNAGEDVQGFAFRRRTLAPYRVRIQHDQFRNRLEMYCTLVFVSAALAALTPAVLLDAGTGTGPIAVICGCFVALGEASYLAALASARGYCAVLKHMDSLPST